jgi:hypothetical protein
MGYYTSFEGEITITPPLPWRDIKDSPFVDAEQGDKDCKLRLVEDTVETDDGTLTRKQAVAVTCTWSGQVKAYRIVEHLQELVDRHGKGRSFIGYIEAEGEDAGDLWRLAVVGGRAVKIQPQIVWPEIPSGGES